MQRVSILSKHHYLILPVKVLARHKACDKTELSMLNERLTFKVPLQFLGDAITISSLMLQSHHIISTTSEQWGTILQKVKLQETSNLEVKITA